MYRVIVLEDAGPLPDVAHHIKRTVRRGAWDYSRVNGRNYLGNSQQMKRLFVGLPASCAVTSSARISQSRVFTRCGLQVVQFSGDVSPQGQGRPSVPCDAIARG